MVLPALAVYALWSVGTLIVSTIITYALMPKPPTPKPSEITDFEAPTAEEGRPIPVVFGTVKIKGANVLWYGGLFTQPIRKKGGKK